MAILKEVGRTAHLKTQRPNLLGLKDNFAGAPLQKAIVFKGLELLSWKTINI